MADRQPETYQRHSQHPGLQVEGRLCRLPRETGRERGERGRQSNSVRQTSSCTRWSQRWRGWEEERERTASLSWPSYDHLQQSKEPSHVTCDPSVIYPLPGTLQWLRAVDLPNKFACPKTLAYWSITVYTLYSTRFQGELSTLLDLRTLFE